MLESCFDASTLSNFPKWKLNPTTKSSSYHSKIVRWKETFNAYSVNHGGLSISADPVIEGMVDIVSSEPNKYQMLL